MARLTLHQLELPRPTTAHPYIPHQPHPHDIMQCLHRLLDGTIIIEPMTLQQVDIVELQPRERIPDGREDPLARETLVVDQSGGTLVFELAVRAERLGHDDDGFARDVVFLEEFAKDDFGFAGRVNVGGVEGLRHFSEMDLGRADRIVPSGRPVTKTPSTPLCQVSRLGATDEVGSQSPMSNAQMGKKTVDPSSKNQPTLIPWSYAYFICFIPSPWSGIIQSCPDPYCIHPRMSLDTCEVSNDTAVAEVKEHRWQSWPVIGKR